MWLDEAVQGGHEKAKYDLGVLYFLDQKHELALQWLDPFAEAGDPQASLICSAILTGKNQPDQWDVPAYRYAKNALNKGNQSAAEFLQILEQRGVLERLPELKLKRQLKYAGIVFVSIAIFLMGGWLVIIDKQFGKFMETIVTIISVVAFFIIFFKSSPPRRKKRRWSGHSQLTEDKGRF